LLCKQHHHVKKPILKALQTPAQAFISPMYVRRKIFENFE